MARTKDIGGRLLCKASTTTNPEQRASEQDLSVLLFSNSQILRLGVDHGHRPTLLRGAKKPLIGHPRNLTHLGRRSRNSTVQPRALT